MPQPTDKATIRRATARDGEVLTSMVRGASAYAGEYRKIVRDVRISPEQIRRDHVYLSNWTARWQASTPSSRTKAVPNSTSCSWPTRPRD